MYVLYVDTEPQLKAKATVSSGHQQLFSGEDVQLTCSVPDDTSSSWKYQWFHDGVSLGFTTVYSINKARFQQSGSYTCQGQKAITTQPYTQSSVLSDPLKIHVDGKRHLVFMLIVVEINNQKTLCVCVYIYIQYVFSDGWI